MLNKMTLKNNPGMLSLVKCLMAYVRILVLEKQNLEYRHRQEIV